MSSQQAYRYGNIMASEIAHLVNDTDLEIECVCECGCYCEYCNELRKFNDEDIKKYLEDYTKFDDNVQLLSGIIDYLIVPSKSSKGQYYINYRLKTMGDIIGNLVHSIGLQTSVIKQYPEDGKNITCYDSNKPSYSQIVYDNNQLLLLLKLDQF